jgi:hypothetical protein
MYTVQVYYSTPSVNFFDSKEELIYFVRNHDYTNESTGQRCNYFLDGIMCNVNDVPAHKYVVASKTKIPCTLVYYRGYLVHDSKGRVIDLRHYMDELYRFDVKAYESKVKKAYIKNHEEWKAKWLEQESIREKRNPKWIQRLPYYRQIRTFQERRYASCPEHKPYIRGSRTHLPDPWNAEIPIPFQRSWKSQIKVRKQWMVNKKMHKDTLKNSLKNTNYKRRQIDEKGLG